MPSCANPQGVNGMLTTLLWGGSEAPLPSDQHLVPWHASTAEVLRQKPRGEVVAYVAEGLISDGCWI